MKIKIKEYVCRLVPSVIILANYFYDFKNYSKYNFGNRKSRSFSAMQAKILRQTHIIEKGLSLSAPRKGFGKEKIETLFFYLEEYCNLDYSKNDIAFRNAINVLYRYTELQKQLGYKNPALDFKLESYKTYIVDDYNCGIKTLSKNEVLEASKGDFKELFLNRHSVRQFSDEPVCCSDIKKAVELAIKAPSACNRQTVKVHYFNDLNTNIEIGKIIPGNSGFADQVKNYLIVTSTYTGYTSAPERNQVYVDGALFSMSLVMSLEYYGIASCILQSSESKRITETIKKIANIPDDEVIVLYIAIGNYKENFQVALSKRKELNEVFIEQ